LGDKHLRFQLTPLADAYVVELEPHGDDRGHFARTFCQSEFSAHGLNPNIVQANMAYSKHRGTLRGVHYQSAPHAEAKLVRCIRGALFDVIVDIRPASNTFCKWFGIELTPDGGKMLYVPEGFAHGYQTLKDHTEVIYQVSANYAPQSEGGLRWNDPLIDIQWPITEGVFLSTKDRAWPDFIP
jgi:dTDP-4-dehydrorhamnose 3,5-epimerase